MATNMQEEMEILKNDVGKLREDLADLVKLLREAGIDRIRETRGSVESELNEQREHLRQQYQNIKNRGSHAVDEVGEQVGEHPMGSLLTAFGIGYIIAKLSGVRS